MKQTSNLNRQNTAVSTAEKRRREAEEKRKAEEANKIKRIKNTVSKSNQNNINTQKAVQDTPNNQNYNFSAAQKSENVYSKPKHNIYKPTQNQENNFNNKIKKPVYEDNTYSDMKREAVYTREREEKEGYENKNNYDIAKEQGITKTKDNRFFGKDGKEVFEDWLNGGFYNKSDDLYTKIFNQKQTNKEQTNENNANEKDLKKLKLENIVKNLSEKEKIGYNISNNLISQKENDINDEDKKKLEEFLNNNLFSLVLNPLGTFKKIPKEFWTNQQMTVKEKENAFLYEHLEFWSDPTNGLNAVMCGEAAKKVAHDKYAKFNEASGKVEDMADGHRQNALQHALWNTLMVLSMGEENAKKFAIAHEVSPIIIDEEPPYKATHKQHSEMDVFFNQVGIDLGLEILKSRKTMPDGSYSDNVTLEEIVAAIEEEITKNYDKVLGKWDSH